MFLKILIVYFAVPYASARIIKTNVDSAKFKNYNGLSDEIETAKASGNFRTQVENKTIIINLDGWSGESDKAGNNIRGLDEQSIIAILKNAEFDANNSAVVTIHNFKSQDENSDGKGGGALGIKAIAQLIHRYLINGTKGNATVNIRNGVDEDDNERLAKHVKKHRNKKRSGNIYGEHGNGRQNYGGRSGDVDGGSLEESGGEGTEVGQNGGEGGKRGDGGGKGGKGSDGGYKAGKGGHAGKSGVGGTNEEKDYGEDNGREGGDGRSNDGKENIDVSDNEDEETTRVERKHVNIQEIQGIPERNIDRLTRLGRSPAGGPCAGKSRSGNKNGCASRDRQYRMQDRSRELLQVAAGRSPEGRRRKTTKKSSKTKKIKIVKKKKKTKRKQQIVNPKAYGSKANGSKANGRLQSGNNNHKNDAKGGGGGGGNGGGGGGAGAGADGGGRGGNGGGNNISFTYNMAIFNYIFDSKKHKKE